MSSLVKVKGYNVYKLATICEFTENAIRPDGRTELDNPLLGRELGDSEDCEPQNTQGREHTIYSKINKPEKMKELGWGWGVEEYKSLTYLTPSQVDIATADQSSLFTTP
mgnify:CR=1 FL=1